MRLRSRWQYFQAPWISFECIQRTPPVSNVQPCTSKDKLVTHCICAKQSSKTNLRKVRVSISNTSQYSKCQHVFRFHQLHSIISRTQVSDSVIPAPRDRRVALFEHHFSIKTSGLRPTKYRGLPVAPTNIRPDSSFFLYFTMTLTDGQYIIRHVQGFSPDGPLYATRHGVGEPITVEKKDPSLVGQIVRPPSYTHGVKTDFNNTTNAVGHYQGRR